MVIAMSNYNCDYVRRTYDVPAEVGRRVISNLDSHMIWSAEDSTSTSLSR